MRRVLLLALNDLRQTVKDRPSLFWMVIMPIGFVFLFSQFGREPRSTQISLAVLDADQTLLSESFGAALARQGFRVEEIDAAGNDSLPAPRRSISIPRGFQDSLLLARQVPVYYYADADAPEEASVVAEMHVLRASLRTLFALSAAARDVAPRQPAADSVFAAAFRAALERAPLVTVAAETAGRGRPVPSGMRQSLPATITLFMLINTTIYGAVFLAVEKQGRILARMATHPMSRLQILAGKLLGAVLIALAQASILLLAGRFLMGAYLGESPGALLPLIVCFALMAASLALFWGAILRKPEQVTAATLVVALFLGAIGGCWWPLEVVPQWMRVAGHVSPAAWAMDGFHAIISFGAGMGAVVVPCLVLLGYALAFLWIGARLLRFTD
ncbi:MAG: ABC transporter permease [Candidatus Eisenbacteria bacterium]